MKFIILLISLFMISCDKPNHFSNQRKFDKSEIQAGLPDGTLVAEPVVLIESIVKYDHP